MKKWLSVFLALALGACLLAGCGGGSGGDKSVTVDNIQEPPELNSILTTTTGSMNVLRHIVDGLTMLDQSDNAIPAAAESWDVSDDNLTYTFHLRQGAKWSNGEAVSAHDFVFAWDTLFTGATGAPYAATWAPLILGAMEKLTAEAEDAAGRMEMTPETKAALEAGGYGEVGYMAVDDNTLKVTLTGPYPYFLTVLAFPTMFPVNEKAYTEIGADKYAKEFDSIVTNGAFKMTGWVHEDNIVLEKDPDYWDAKNIKLDKITIVAIQDVGTRYNSFQAGEVDMINLSGEQSAQLKEQGESVLSFDDGSNWYFEFNTAIPGFANQKVREAVTRGVDVDVFIANVVMNGSTAAACFTPPAIENGEFTKAVGTLIDRVDDADYSAVKALLEEGLEEEGLDLSSFKPTLIIDDTTTGATYAAFFQEQLRNNLGLEIAIEQMSYKNRIDRMQNKDFDVVWAGWSPDYNDPMTFLEIFTSYNGNNHTSYANPTYDTQIEQAMTEPDPAARQALLIEAENILCSDLPVGPIYNRAIDYICSDKLTGVVRSAFQDFNLRWAEVK